MQIVQLAKSIMEYNADLVEDQLKELSDLNRLFQHPKRDLKTSLYHLALTLPPWNSESKKKKKQIIDLIRDAGADYYFRDSLERIPLFDLKRNFGYANETSSPLKQLITGIDDEWFVLDMPVRMNKESDDYRIVRTNTTRDDGGKHMHIASKPLLDILSNIGPLKKQEIKGVSIFSAPILKRSYFKNSKIDDSGKIDDLRLEAKLPNENIFMLEASECVIVKKEQSNLLRKIKGLILVPATNWCSHYV